MATIGLNGWLTSRRSSSFSSAKSIGFSQSTSNRMKNKILLFSCTSHRSAALFGRDRHTSQKKKKKKTGCPSNDWLWNYYIISAESHTTCNWIEIWIVVSPSFLETKLRLFLLMWVHIKQFSRRITAAGFLPAGGETHNRDIIQWSLSPFLLWTGQVSRWRVLYNPPICLGWL